jgi:transcription antitermination factor NusG
MSVNMDTIVEGDRVRFADGGLVDEGVVTGIDHDAYIVRVEFAAADGTPCPMELDPDEPGLEVIA